jgi:hypothetical protein
MSRSNSSLLARDGIRPLASRSAPSTAASTSSWRGGGARPPLRRAKEKLDKLHIEVQTAQWSAREGDDLFALDVVAADGSSRWTTHRRWREFLKLAERLPPAGIACRLPPTSRRDMTSRIAALQAFVDALEPSTMQVPMIATFFGANAFVRAATHRSALLAVNMAANRQARRTESAAAAGRSGAHQAGREDLLPTPDGGGVSISPPPVHASTWGAVSRSAAGTRGRPTASLVASGVGGVDGELPSSRPHRGLIDTIHTSDSELATPPAPGWASQAGARAGTGVMPATALHQAPMDDRTSSHRQLEGSATDATGDGTGDAAGGAAAASRATVADIDDRALGNGAVDRPEMGEAGVGASENGVAEASWFEAAVSPPYRPFVPLPDPRQTSPAAAAAPAWAAPVRAQAPTASPTPSDPLAMHGPGSPAAEAGAAAVEKACETAARAEAGGEAEARAAELGASSPRTAGHDPALGFAAPPAAAKLLEVHGSAAAGPSMGDRGTPPRLALLARAPSRAPACSGPYEQSMTPQSEAKSPTHHTQGPLSPMAAAGSVAAAGSFRWPSHAGPDAEQGDFARRSPAAASVEPASRQTGPRDAEQGSTMQGYAEQGYAQQGYAGQGYAGQGHAVPAPQDPAALGADSTASRTDATRASAAGVAAATGSAAPRGRDVANGGLGSRDAESQGAACGGYGSRRWSSGSSLSSGRGSLPSISVWTKLVETPRPEALMAPGRRKAAPHVQDAPWVHGGLPTPVQPIQGQATAEPSPGVDGNGALTPNAGGVNGDGALTPHDSVDKDAAGTPELELAFRRALSAPAVRLRNSRQVTLAMANSATPHAPVAADPPATACGGAAARSSAARPSAPAPARQAAAPAAAGPATAAAAHAAALEASGSASHSVALRSSSICLCATEPAGRSPAAALAEHEARACEAARRMAEHVAADEGARVAAELYAVEEAMRLATEQATLAEVARRVAELALANGEPGKAAEHAAAAQTAHRASVEAARACSARVAVAEAARRAAARAHAEEMVAIVAARVAREFVAGAGEESAPGGEVVAGEHARGEEATPGRPAARAEHGSQGGEVVPGAAGSVGLNGMASDAARAQARAAERAQAAAARAVIEAARAAAAAAHAQVGSHAAVVRPSPETPAKAPTIAAQEAERLPAATSTFAAVSRNAPAATDSAKAQRERSPGVYRGGWASVCPEAHSRAVELFVPAFDAEQEIAMIKLSCCPRTGRLGGEGVAPPLPASPTLRPSLAGVGGGTSRAPPRVSFADEAVLASLSPARIVRSSFAPCSPFGAPPDSPSGAPTAENPATAVTERTTGGSAANHPLAVHSPAGGKSAIPPICASPPPAATGRKSPPSADLQCAFERRLSAVQSETEQLQTGIAALLALPPIQVTDGDEDEPDLRKGAGTKARLLAPLAAANPRQRRRGCAAPRGAGHLLLLVAGLVLAVALYSARVSPAHIELPPPRHASPDVGRAPPPPKGLPKRRPAAHQHAPPSSTTGDAMAESRHPGSRRHPGARLRAGAVAMVSRLASTGRHVRAALNHVALGLGRVEGERLRRQRGGAVGVWQWVGQLVSRGGRVLDRFGSALEGGERRQ